MTKKLKAEIAKLNQETYQELVNKEVTEQNYYKILGDIQNAPRFEHIDIMTFSGFMDTWEDKVNYLKGKLEQLNKS